MIMIMHDLLDHEVQEMISWKKIWKYSRTITTASCDNVHCIDYLNMDSTFWFFLNCLQYLDSNLLLVNNSEDWM